MSFAGVTLALTAVQAISQIGQGRAEKAEMNYNATLLEGKAGLIDVQKGIEGVQYERAKARMASTTTANVAGAGLMMSGSPMAVLLDAQQQLNIDKAIGQFNLQQQKQYTLAEADSARRAGQRAQNMGYSNALSTMLSGAATYAMYKGLGNKPTNKINTEQGAKG